MNPTTLTRREMGGLTMASLAVLGSSEAAGAPRVALPPLACDCHVHVVGPQATYPMMANREYTPPPATVADLLAFRSALGLSRSVLIQPSFYGTDNRCLLDALAQLDGTARGVAVVGPGEPIEALRAMDRQGVRGLRVNLETAGNRDAGSAAATLRALADRIGSLGWHLQIYAALPVIAAAADAIAKLPVPVVVDHYGVPVAAKGVDQPGFSTLVDLVRSANVYVKLSAPYRVSKAPPYDDAAPFARALIAAAPARIVWASDWPHTDRVPGRAATDIHPYRVIDDAGVLDRFEAWCPDPATRKLIFSETPAKLYNFS